MTKDVTAQEMQEHFAELIEEVRRGVTLRLTDGTQLVAQITPAQTVERDIPAEMIFRDATSSWADFVAPPPIAADIDVVALLREDRDAR